MLYASKSPLTFEAMLSWSSTAWWAGGDHRHLSVVSLEALLATLSVQFPAHIVSFWIASYGCHCRCDYGTSRRDNVAYQNGSWM
jgi:hypothetical protein